MLLLGDCLEQMKTLEANSVDAVVTDPPYGLSKEPNIAEVMQHWINGDKYEHDSKGFMGKSWDSFVPGPEIWREVFRVLKPGGHILCFAGTRTIDLMTVSLRFAGFEIRDQVQWIYGSGFPKSHNVSKAIDKIAGAKGETYIDEDFLRRNPSDNDDGVFDSGLKDGISGAIRTRPATPEAKQWDGWGSALKPANEPVCLARKPLEKGLTLAENVLKYGTGAINVDGCRIGSENLTYKSRLTANANMNDDGWNKIGKDAELTTVQGRWPANVLFDEDAAEMLDAQSGALKSGKPGIKNKGNSGAAYGAESRPPGTQMSGFGDSGGASRFFYVAKASKSERSKGLDSSFLVWENDAWEKQDLKSALTAMLELAKDTSADILADDSSWSTDIYGHSISEQYPKGMIFTISTVLKTITELKTLSASQSLNTRESIQDAIKTIEASGLSLAESVSFINQLELNTTSEKTAYLLGVVRAALPMLLQIKGFAKTNNFHSTVKPIKLMEYLIKLITPPNGTVLDPFMGSGSTGVACKNLNKNFIGIEMNEEYFEIAKRRVESC